MRSFENPPLLKQRDCLGDSLTWLEGGWGIAKIPGCQNYEARGEHLGPIAQKLKSPRAVRMKKK